MRNIKIVIEYDGSKYKGWQKQNDDTKTIQGKIENVLSKMTNQEIQLIGCGRTDAGVHAINYTANFHTESTMKIFDMFDYFLEYLPDDIVVKSIKDCSDRFHSRYNVLSKTYLYKINNNRIPNVFNRKYTHFIKGKLDIDAMKEASKEFIGTHDFQSFTTLKSKTKSTVRNINYINIIHDENIIDIEINGNGFLWNMVRIIMGTLIEVGKGTLDASMVKTILEEKKRSEAGPMVPAKALFLKDVEY